MAQVKKGCVQAAGVLVMYVARHRISGERRILAGFSFPISLLSFYPFLPPLITLTLRGGEY